MKSRCSVVCWTESPSKCSEAEPDLQVLELAKHCNTSWTVLNTTLLILGLSMCRDISHSGNWPQHLLLTAIPLMLQCRTCNRFILVWVHLLSCFHSQEITHREHDKTRLSLDATFSMFSCSVSYFFLKQWNHFYVQCPFSQYAPCNTQEMSAYLFFCLRKLCI